jgi:hypothetical protein
MVKKIAVYGDVPAKVHVRQRYWHVRTDGIRQRYWHKTKKTKIVPKSKRWEIHGEGKKLYKATVIAHRYLPKEDFTTISADKLIESPEKYGERGEWIEKPEVEYAD